MLSSIHNVERVEDEDLKRRPEAILLYNETKGGTDTPNEMLRGVKEMAFSNLFQLLDIVCLDAYVICKNVGIENDSQRCFLLQLGEALCDAKRKKRKPSIFRLLPVV